MQTYTYNGKDYFGEVIPCLMPDNSIQILLTDGINAPLCVEFGKWNNTKGAVDLNTEIEKVRKSNV